MFNITCSVKGKPKVQFITSVSSASSLLKSHWPFTMIHSLLHSQLHAHKHTETCIVYSSYGIMCWSVAEWSWSGKAVRMKNVSGCWQMWSNFSLLQLSCFICICIIMLIFQLLICWAGSSYLLISIQWLVNAIECTTYIMELTLENVAWKRQKQSVMNYSYMWLKGCKSECKKMT